MWVDSCVTCRLLALFYLPPYTAYNLVNKCKLTGNSEQHVFFFEIVKCLCLLRTNNSFFSLQQITFHFIFIKSLRANVCVCVSCLPSKNRNNDDNSDNVVVGKCVERTTTRTTTTTMVVAATVVAKWYDFCCFPRSYFNGFWTAYDVVVLTQRFIVDAWCVPCTRVRHRQPPL